jgi:hypothetical protein
MIFRGMGPDAYAPKKRPATLEIADLCQQPDPFKEKDIPIPPISTRQWIAKLIRELTYRELMQISTEIEKCVTLKEDRLDRLAQTLDDWAHMVKEEDECVSGMPPLDNNF